MSEWKVPDSDGKVNQNKGIFFHIQTIVQINK
jgi:hypothetical protein